MILEFLNLNLNVNCVNGDQFYISNEDMAKVLYNHSLD